MSMKDLATVNFFFKFCLFDLERSIFHYSYHLFLGLDSLPDEFCFCGMVDRRKVFSLISSRDHCQRSSPSRISETPRAGFEPAQNLSSGLV